MKRMLVLGCAAAVLTGATACGGPGSAKQEELEQQVPPLGQLPELPSQYFPPPPEPSPEPAPEANPVDEPVTVTALPAPEQPAQPERVTVVEVQPPPPPPPPAPPPPPPPPAPERRPNQFSVPIGPGQLHVDLPG